MMVQPFGTDDEGTAPAFWVFERDIKECSLRQLLQRFYDDFDPEEELTYKPLSMVYNPETADGKRIFSFDHDQVAVFVYRRGFYCVLEKHYHSIEGPHTVMLYYRSYQVHDVVWVATLQMDEAMFYDEDKLKSRLTEYIKQHEFYQSDKSGEIIIIL